MHLLSTELAARAFDADAAFSAALAEFQSAEPTGSLLEEVRRAAGHGLAWYCRPSVEPGFYEVQLRHKAGAEISAKGESLTALLAGLLGYALAHDIAVAPGAQAAEPDKICDSCILSPGEQSEPKLKAESSPAPVAAEALVAPTPAVQVAAESLAAATSGAAVTEPVPDSGPATPLTAEQKAAAVAMIKALTPDQRRAFTISFRDVFKVPREAKAIAPLITQHRHLRFCDDWSIEAAGGVAE
jgi:hypothetical protein